MLNMIKDMIKQKAAFQEAADLILEDESIDDMIILHEDSDVEDIDEKEDGLEDGQEPADNGDKIDDVEEPVEGNDDDDNENDGGILNDKIDDDDNEELPTAIGVQTGEPAQIGDGDLLSVEIDLATNTPNDLLPIPPTGATDMIPGSDRMRVSSGFSMDDAIDDDDSRDPVREDEAASLLDLPIDEETDTSVARKEQGKERMAREKAIPSEKTDEFAEETDLMDESIDTEDDSEEKSESVGLSDLGISDFDSFDEYTIDDDSFDLLTEEISIGSDPAAPANDGTAPDANTANDTNNAAAEPPADNAVTAAVKDKVDEMDSASVEPVDTTANNSSKEAILKKLGNLSKAIEDTKNLVIDSTT